jgi:hypothetical protein
MRDSKLQGSVIAAVILCAAVGLFVWSCKYPSAPPLGNAPPSVRMANVPPNDTIAQYIRLGAIPEITLYWLGDDPDGYVIAFKYRWVDYPGGGGPGTPRPYQVLFNIPVLGPTPIENPILLKGPATSMFRVYNFITTLNDRLDAALIRLIGDSLATLRPFRVPYEFKGLPIIPEDSIAGANSESNPTPTRGKFIFDSPADSNKHVFEVTAIDNDMAESPTPARVTFWTLRSPAPLVIINSSPALSPVPIVRRYATDYFRGLRFAFSALDPTTFEQEFSWAVDDTTRWSPWSTSGVALVTASYFNPIVSGTHTFYVRAKNRWGAISNIVSRQFTAYIPRIDDPTWPKRTLILNNDRHLTPSRGVPDSNRVKAFYSGVMDAMGKAGRYDIWTTASKTPVGLFPPRELITDYTSVLLLSEQRLTTFQGGQQIVNADKQQILIDYLYAGGGKLILSPPPDVRTSFLNWEVFSATVFKTVATNIIPFQQNPLRDFIGAKGVEGYPTIMLDSLKFPVDSLVAGLGALRNISLNFPVSFAQSTSLFDSYSNIGFEDLPVGIRFLAPPGQADSIRTYSAINFGFPLYYADSVSVIAGLRKAFEDLNE